MPISNDLGRTTAPRSWSEGAINCYQRGLRCGSDCDNWSKCREYVTTHRIPPMKANVLECVRRFDKPKGIKQYLREY